MTMGTREDSRHILALLALVAVVYGPYVVRGGLLRDDLGFVLAPRNFGTYVEFQTYLSSLLTMTARPVSAILHGAAYWFLGANAVAHHTANLALFAGSIVLVYYAIRRACDSTLALMTCGIATVYPAATGTVFSAMMMNSNLAGLLWAGSLCISCSRPASLRKDIAVALLLVLSGLSYESFVPLFAANIAARESRTARFSARGMLARGAPVLCAIAVLAAYRLFLEHLIFATSFTRAAMPDANLPALGFVVVDGLRVAFVDTIIVSFRALRNVCLVAPLELVGSAIALIAVTWTVFRAIFGKQCSAGRRTLVVAAAIFLAAHLIFVFSDYRPTIRGFENRTQGAIRFAAAFVISTATCWGMSRLAFRRLVPASTFILIFVLFTLGMLGQREAWIEAANYNRRTTQEIGRALQQTGVTQGDSILIVAELKGSKHSVNREPTFGTSWDLGPALGLANPTLRIGANVYKPAHAQADSQSVTLDGYWRAPYPFLYFRSGIGGMRRISSSRDWLDAIADK